jgi:prepilin-type N-terminal cleavage/methylation domain-containing protein
MMRSYSRIIARGFNLVEMAVVIVIVGLLLGGILRGTEMINSAKARNIIDQSSSIQTAILAFSNRFKATAGDLTQVQANFIGSGVMFSGAVGSTAGDGIIAFTQPALSSNESVLVFQNLSATGLLSCSSCTRPATPAVAGNAIATYSNSPVNAANGFLQYGTTPASAAGLYWLDAAVQPSRNMMTTGALISGSILRQIDIKTDDGAPATGLFRQSTTGGASATAKCAPAGAWSTAESNCAGAWLF